MPERPANSVACDAAPSSAAPGAKSAPRSPWSRIGLRVALVAVGLGLWFYTQSLIQLRPYQEGQITDLLHEWLAGPHAYLLAHPAAANALLIASSAVIDLLGIFLLLRSIFGPSFRPFVGLVILFGLRQSMQAACALPAPEGMIWRDPGFPSLLVTYGVSHDLFFSGHTALAVFGAIELSRLRIGPRGVWMALGAMIALGEILTVLVLRAHWTMDVFAAIPTAALIAWLLSPKGQPSPQTTR